MTAQSLTSADPERVARSIQVAKNQSLFREVNERIETLNDSFSTILGLGDWICECGDAACFEPISLTLNEYEAVRAHPTRFPVLPGHELPELEKVVERNERYLVVEKLGPANAIATAQDPRNRSNHAGPPSMQPEPSTHRA